MAFRDGLSPALIEKAKGELLFTQIPVQEIVAASMAVCAGPKKRNHYLSARLRPLE